MSADSDVLDYLREHPGSRRSDVAGALGMTECRVSRRLSSLVRYGMIHIVAYDGGVPRYAVDAPDGDAERPRPLREAVTEALSAGPRTIPQMEASIGRDISCSLMHRMMRDGLVEVVGTCPAYGDRGNLSYLWRLLRCLWGSRGSASSIPMRRRCWTPSGAPRTA